MIVPQTSEYALRLMSYLALQADDTRLNAEELAKQTNIPKPYISKIIRKLVVAKLLDAQRGPGGGISISKPLASIRFIDILIAVDYDSDPKHCAYGWGQCNTNAPCPLHPTWSKLKESFHNWAEKATLAEVRKNSKNLNNRFTLPR